MVERTEDRTPAHGPSPIGIIDVGSNTARLVVFDTSPAFVVRPIFEFKEIPRLGSETHEDGSLDASAVERGVQTLRRFARTLEGLGVTRTLAVTTSAVRDAPNGPDFLRQAERSSGVLLRVLTGSEEARYGYLGVASAWELHDDLVVDLGGGSLQLAETRNGTLANSVSLPLGVLRLTQRHVEHDPPRERELDAMQEEVRASIRSAVEAFGGSGYRLFAMGGTVRAIARAAIDLRGYPIPRVHGYTIRNHDLDGLAELIADLPVAKRRAVPGIGSERADVIDAGLIVFSELLRSTKASEIVVSGTGIREGIALEAIGAPLPASAVELVTRSVAAAAERFSFSVARGEEVSEIALQLFELFAERFEWGENERLALLVAARMHDAGISIDLWRHAHHSSYLIRNYPLWGLSHRQTLLAASIVALHAGDDLPSGMRKGLTAILRSSDTEAARKLGAILQAGGLLAPAGPKFSLGSGGRLLTVTFTTPPDTTLPPRTLEKARKAMEREFNIEVRVRDG
jgi:exopolyphosphatase/guanosine-5'-triphosphate,3'-diphosphate pyrophosphatase